MQHHSIAPQAGDEVHIPVQPEPKEPISAKLAARWRHHAKATSDQFPQLMSLSLKDL